MPTTYRIEIGAVGGALARTLVDPLGIDDTSFLAALTAARAVNDVVGLLDSRTVDPGTAPLPAFSTIQDEFITLDATAWSGAAGTSNGDDLVIVPTTTYPAVPYFAARNLTNSSIAMRVTEANFPTLSAEGNVTNSTILRLDATNYILLNLVTARGAATAQTANLIEAYLFTNDVPARFCQVTYNHRLHRHLRIRHALGQIHIDAAPDGERQLPNGWSEIGTPIDVTFPLTALQLVFQAGFVGGGVLTGTANFCIDNINVTSAPPVGPDANYAPTGNVTLTPGNLTQANVNNVVNNTIVVGAGIHRFTTPITPRANQQFLGQPGAILKGTKVLDPAAFVADGTTGRWRIPGQTQRLFRNGAATCAAGTPYCNHAEDVWVDGVQLTQVGSRAEVTDGTKFFMGYGSASEPTADMQSTNVNIASNIYLWGNPAGKLIETTLAEKAFIGNSGGQTFKNLIIEQFGSSGQHAALEATNATVENCEFRQNHGRGCSLFGTFLGRYNHFHNNGQMGWGGAGAGTWIYNECSYSNEQGYLITFEAGGIKMAADSNNTRIRKNYVHHNHGSGIAFDVRHINHTIEDNTSTDNGYQGIVSELSKTPAGIIRRNYTTRNGTEAHTAPYPPIARDGVGILVFNSQGATVYENVSYDDRGGGILLAQDGRTTDGTNTFHLQNNTIYRNFVRFGGISFPWFNYFGLGRWVGMDIEPSVRNIGADFYTGRSNVFRDNEYLIATGSGGATAAFWFYHNDADLSIPHRGRTLAYIKGVGNEVGSTSGAY